MENGPARQLDKFRGIFSAFVSLWTGLAQADKLKGRRCISLLFVFLDFSISIWIRLRQNYLPEICVSKLVLFVVLPNSPSFPFSPGKRKKSMKKRTQDMKTKKTKTVTESIS